MPFMTGIPFYGSRVNNAHVRFNAVGLVLHRTEAGFNHLLKSFQTATNAPHLLLGKTVGQIVQFVDIDYRAQHVGPGANDLYIGFIFESIPAYRGYRGQDPLVIQDILNIYQVETGKR